MAAVPRGRARACRGGARRRPSAPRRPGPAIAVWPVDTSLSAGRIIVDLIGTVLPLDERVEVSVGVGDIRVDGITVDNGLGAAWAKPPAGANAVQVDAHVGVGTIDIRHG